METIEHGGMKLYPNYEYMDKWYRTIPEQPLCPAAYIIPYTPLMEEYDDTGDDMLRQPPFSTARILSLYETQYPQSFIQLERYRIPRFVLRRIFRTVIGYVLRYTNPIAIPQPVSRYAEALLNRIVSARPMFQNLFTYFGVPVALSRGILLNLIMFTLNQLALGIQ